MKKYILKTSIITLSLLLAACNCQQTENEKDLVFPKGEKLVSNNFIGDVWFTPLVTEDSLNQNAVGSVTFAPGARTNWHLHPSGQILLAISGTGYYQEKGSPIVILHKGDVAKCPPDIPHWHGASPDEEFVQVAITGRQNGPTEWLEPVTDDEYDSIK